jgi:hypothetical protein
MTRAFSSGNHMMVIWAQEYDGRYYARWFCSCGQFWGESKPQYPNADAAIDAGEKALSHLYETHPDNKPNDEAPKSN